MNVCACIGNIIQMSNLKETKKKVRFGAERFEGEEKIGAFTRRKAIFGRRQHINHSLKQ